MGFCLSKGEDDLVNDEINDLIQKDKKRLDMEVKMLLLGTGESGKSTILKQMKMIHTEGYTTEERQSFKEICFSNVLTSMKAILEAMNEFGVALTNPANSDYKIIILAADSQLADNCVFPVEYAVAIKALWQDAGVQAMFARSNEYQLNDSAKYFFDSIDRLSDPKYVPNDQDVLRSRVKTTGISENTFVIKDMTFKLYDVGGQRSERKKWIHCFEDVTAIIFLVALSEYDQVLLEDESVNRMQEALTLFDSICNSRWFVKTSIILFLNKIDIFKEKIMRTPIGKYFPEYRGGADYEAATRFFIQRFVALNHSEGKQIYPHLTCATDTGQIKFVMNAVQDIIIKNLLQQSNLI